MQNPERIQLQHQEESEDLQIRIEQKEKELFEVLGVKDKKEAKAKDLNELSPEEMQRAHSLSEEVRVLKEKEKEFNPEREKEKLIEWAEENLGKNTEEAREFIDQNFTIDTDNERVVVEDDINFVPFAGILKEMPGNITFEGLAYFSGCTSLKEIPDNAIFEGYAYFTNCTSLKEIPDNTIFEGDAYFGGCTSLTQESIEKLEKMKEDGKIRGGLIL